ncbi:1-deoxy-D-xylulose-5-phosphate reductoisomerase [Pseudoalteromonas ulvae UL12]|uniref:1-deoxy-D-xylulose-5-phosphate reductoisomerase n=1 Tax=Pseudoalteromonas ulvae TaxID=107327 RepID=UPI00186BA8D3|nr:1-deoxy-D-xylulose-5-phosphate reductoisomerase [Pseudoalteromonas ulvae]MBE0363542.1 1-deoxy-D-xylulose-5-phosphate reductoisomerase [Pseudoalteromonas ulvae UL12]
MIHSGQQQRICILGSTGSIGVSTLDVISRNPDVSVYALTAHHNHQLMLTQCLAFSPRYAVMADEATAAELTRNLKLHGGTTEVLFGPQALCDVASSTDVTVVMAAIVGAAGLAPTLAAVEASKKILLANKEALVMSGQLFIEKVKQHKAVLLPIDSEHNAIFQALPFNEQTPCYEQALSQLGVSKILLTGSGGPFLERALSTLPDVTVQEAVAHPNWSMGQKISVDSATMMNKGLEFIEAKWMFNCQASDIEVIIHPQSIIHSMVQYRDGSVIAQMGNPDMRTPIAHALAFPKRIDAGVEPLDFSSLAQFSFCKPDYARYPNLQLAISACDIGQAATTIVNAANEIAVAAFLTGTIRFTDIYRINYETLNQIKLDEPTSLEQIIAIDAEARRVAEQRIKQGAN